MKSYSLFTVDFGPSKANATGSTGVGYTVLDSTGAVAVPRTTTGVFQTAPGIYTAAPTFPNTDVAFQIVWDTGSAFSRTFYASETAQDLEQFYNLTGSLSTLSTALNSAADVINNASEDIKTIALDVAFIRDFTAGRWKMSNDQMVFYKEDNVTEIARFSLLDDGGRPSMDAVFERRKLP